MPQQQPKLGVLFLLTPLREGRRSRCLRTERRNHFYSRPCGRGDGAVRSGRRGPRNFYSRPCGRGDSRGLHRPGHRKGISTHAPAGGATRSQIITSAISSHFYSRPCGRGDAKHVLSVTYPDVISTHAPAGGATLATVGKAAVVGVFLLTPLREGRRPGRRK